MNASIDNEGVLCRFEDSCLLCGAAGDEIYRGLRDRIFGSPGAWSVRRCSNVSCGLGWIDPQPLPGEVGKLYQAYYTHGSQGGSDSQIIVSDIIVSHWVGSNWRRKSKRLLSLFVPWARLRLDNHVQYLGHRKYPGRVLDVGCGDGHNSRVFSAVGWLAVGIDFDEKAVAEARRQGVDARVGDLASFSFPTGHFDAIFMDNVIEHIRDVVPFFEECRRVLKSGGRLIMITPNLDSLGHAQFGQDWRGLEIPRHLNIFSRKSLRAALKLGGFRHVEVFPRTRWPDAAVFMMDQSRIIAVRSGREPPNVDGRRTDFDASLRAFFGASRTEWIIGLAERE